MNTRRYPRTLNEAFGPYSSGPIYEKRTTHDWQDRIVMAGSIAVGLVFVAMLVAGVVA